MTAGKMDFQNLVDSDPDAQKKQELPTKFVRVLTRLLQKKKNTLLPEGAVVSSPHFHDVLDVVHIRGDGICLPRHYQVMQSINIKRRSQHSNLMPLAAPLIMPLAAPLLLNNDHLQ